MKKKVAINTIKKEYTHIFKADYCALQHIFTNVEPNYFSDGIYGWNCDIYTNHQFDIAIMTGYRGMAGKKIPNELIKKYSLRANYIIRTCSTCDETKERLNQNRRDFLLALLQK